MSRTFRRKKSSMPKWVTHDDIYFEPIEEYRNVTHIMYDQKTDTIIEYVEKKPIWVRTAIQRRELKSKKELEKSIAKYHGDYGYGALDKTPTWFKKLTYKGERARVKIQTHNYIMGKKDEIHVGPIKYVLKWWWYS